MQGQHCRDLDEISTKYFLITYDRFCYDDPPKLSEVIKELFPDAKKQ